MTKPTLLISGDSYMALHKDGIGTPESVEKDNQIHWSRHLDPYFEIQNVAKAGSSNTSIVYRLVEAIKKQKPDYILIGFTDYARLEYNKYETNCHPSIQKDKSAYNAWKQYIKYADDDYMRYKSMAIIEYAVTLARSIAPTCFALNLLNPSDSDWSFYNKHQFMINFEKESLPVNLSDYPEISLNDPNWKSFHVVDPKVHEKFAETILDEFNICKSDKV